MFAIVIHAIVIRLPNIKPCFDQISNAVCPSSRLFTYLGPCLECQPVRIARLLDETHASRHNPLQADKEEKLIVVGNKGDSTLLWWLVLDGLWPKNDKGKRRDS